MTLCVKVLGEWVTQTFGQTDKGKLECPIYGGQKTSNNWWQKKMVKVILQIMLWFNENVKETEEIQDF